MLIFVLDGVPYVRGYNLESNLKNETEHCSTTVFPNYNYEQKIVAAGV